MNPRKGEGAYIIDAGGSETRGLGQTSRRGFRFFRNPALQKVVLSFDGRGEGALGEFDAAGSYVFVAFWIREDSDDIEAAFGPLVAVFGGDMGGGGIVRADEDEAFHAGEVKSGGVWGGEL